jgi:hypothetical protein
MFLIDYTIHRKLGALGEIEFGQMKDPPLRAANP